MDFSQKPAFFASLLVVFVVWCCFIAQGNCFINTTTTPPSPQTPCSVSSTCEQCLGNVTCLWCQTNNTCLDYPVSHVLPPASLCQLSQARWAVCWVNFEAVIIAMAVVLGTILLSIIICCCCCCRHKRSSEPVMDDERYARQLEVNKQRSDDRKSERKARYDEIRKKYGLVPDSEHPYSKFEND